MSGIYFNSITVSALLIIFISLSITNRVGVAETLQPNRSRHSHFFKLERLYHPSIPKSNPLSFHSFLSSSSEMAMIYISVVFCDLYQLFFVLKSKAALLLAAEELFHCSKIELSGKELVALIMPIIPFRF